MRKPFPFSLTLAAPWLGARLTLGCTLTISILYEDIAPGRTFFTFCIAFQTPPPRIIAAGEST